MKAQSRSLLRLLALSGVLLSGFMPTAHSATLTWNGGVSGDWLNSGAGWLNGVSAATWNNSTPDSAVFSGTGSTNVTINSGGVTVDDITVSSGTYSFGGTGTLTLANSAIDIASGLTTTINSALAGTTGLTKTGAGTLVLSGNNKNYTGTTTITGGAIQISDTAAGYLGSTTNGAVSLNGGALYGNFSANKSVGYAISVGANGGELRNLVAGRWQMASNTISGSGTLKLSFGTVDTRFEMGTTTQNSFSGKWIIDSGGNVNRFVDVDGNSTFGSNTADDAITLVNSGNILFRNTRTYGATYGITLGSGGGGIATGGTQTVTLAAKISGAAGNNFRLDLGNSASVLILTNTANSWLGATSLVNAGTLRLGNSGVITDNGGTIDMGSTTSFDLNGKTETIGGLSGTGIVRNNDSLNAATLTLGGNGQNANFGGTIGAGAGVINLGKTGNGTQTLSGTISYTGSTTVSSGALQLSESTSRSYAGQISGAGTILKSGAGTLTLSNASNSIGRLRIDGGAVTVTGGLTSHGSGSFAVADYGNASLNINGGSVSISGGREFVVGLQSTGAVNLTGGSLTVASGVTVGIGSHAGTIYGNSGDGTLAISSGTATIQGTSTEFIYLARPRTDDGSTGNFTGVINVTGGTLETARTFAEGTNTTLGTKTSSITLNGGTLKALGNNSNWIDSSIDTVTFGSSGATIDTNGFEMTIAKAATGAGGLTKSGSGTLVLTGINTYSGLTSVNGGTLIVGDGVSGSVGNVTINTGGTLGGSGTVGNLTVTNGGILAPGNSPGILNSGDLSIEAGATLGIEIDGAVPGSGHDQLVVTGSVSLAGLLSIATSYTPAENALFFILVNDGNDAISGTFSNAPVDGGTYTFGSQQYQISYFGNSGNQSFTGGNDVVLMAIPEPRAALLGGLGLLILLNRRKRVQR